MPTHTVKHRPLLHLASSVVVAVLASACTGVNPLVASDARVDRPNVVLDVPNFDAQTNDVVVRDRTLPDSSIEDVRLDVQSDIQSDVPSDVRDVRLVDVVDVPPIADTGPPLPQCRPPNGNNCPAGVAQAPAMCPAECTGGCMGSTCLIDCSAQSACQAATIRCPPRMACRINCTGLSACQVSTIVCDDDSPCDINCGFTSTCQVMNLHCPLHASCNLSCTGISSCQQGSVACGEGVCNMSCTEPSASLAHVDCGNSCSCGSTCGCDP